MKKKEYNTSVVQNGIRIERSVAPTSWADATSVVLAGGPGN